ncbi:MAG: YciK family oxidoreductase [Gammaproteobacteria bacterium]|nr:YciK family oxidoreductase [Gammaproteobacteria bacterium]
MTDKIEYTPPPNILKDRVILVTGAGDGIGRAAALAFAAHGATSILLGRTMHKLEAVYDEIEQAGYPQAAIYPMNLEGAGPKDYGELADRLEDEFGHLNGLLHNAALLGTLTPLELYDANLWYRVVQINLHAPYMLTQACLRLLRKSSDASIVFTSANAGRKGRAYWGAYGVSKWGIEGMAQILAEEVQINTAIRVNTIDTGAVRTKMRAQAFPGEDPNTLPLPEAIMPAYVFLMGPDSKKIHGQALNAQ